MCAPCKVVINEEAEACSARATTIAGFMVQAARGGLPTPGDEEALYELAEAEVEFIERVRRSGVQMAQRVGAPKRWIDLMERL